jgi:2-dehydropantoate 2-reductase
MGSGGVGGYFGARLANGGAEVTFIARGAHLAAMRANGLAINSAHEPLHLPKVNATDHAASVRSISCCSASSSGIPKAPRVRCCRS